jgi:hypothetical protein
MIVMTGSTRAAEHKARVQELGIERPGIGLEGSHRPGMRLMFD